MPWVSPAEIHEAGFAMIMYPTTLLFQITRTVERALSALKAGKPMLGESSVDLDAFEDIVGLPSWKAIEEKFGGRE